MYIYYMPFFPLVKSPGWGWRIKRQNDKSSSGTGGFSVCHDGEKFRQKMHKGSQKGYCGVMCSRDTI
jgi:hypothetical protein